GVAGLEREARGAAADAEGDGDLRRLARPREDGDPAVEERARADPAWDGDAQARRRAVAGDRPERCERRDPPAEEPRAARERADAAAGGGFDHGEHRLAVAQPRGGDR